MEDRRTAIAILLIIITVMMYSELVLAPSMQPARTTSQQQGAGITSNTAALNGNGTAAQSAANGMSAPQAAAVIPGAAPQLSLDAPPSPAELRAAESFSIETPHIIASFSQLGGRLSSFQLKQHLDHLGEAKLLDLVSHSDGTALPLGVYSGERSDSRTQYQIEKVEPAGAIQNHQVSVAPNGQASITLKGTLSDGSEIRKTFTFRGDAYLFNVLVHLEKPAADGTSLWLEWTRSVSEELLHDRIDPLTYSYLTEAEKVQHVMLPSLTLDGLSQPSGVRWLGLADKYFTSTLITDQTGFNSRYGKVGSVYLSRVAGSPTDGHFSLFVGPKDYRILKEEGFSLERSIDLGFFAFLAYPLLLMIRVLHSVFGNYGLSIVGLTLLVKGIFFPLTRASLRSMKAMQAVQPEVAALRERIKDPTQLNQELLQLYKRRGVNPLGGCLPILLQIPVFFGLYSALQHSIELRHAKFALWINDLSMPEQLHFIGINFPIMILLMGAAMFYQQWSTPMPSADPSQRRMMLWMSAIFPVSFLIYPFPSGLALYMLTNTSISLIQQAYLRNDTHTHPGRATALASLGIFAVAFVLTLV